MRPLLLAAALSVLAGGAAAQTVPGSEGRARPAAPSPESAAATRPAANMPDPADNAMADPGSAAEFGSPSATGSPSSPMPNPNSWPTPRKSDKRPDWVKKAPPASPTPPS